MTTQAESAADVPQAVPAADMDLTARERYEVEAAEENLHCLDRRYLKRLMLIPALDITYLFIFGYFDMNSWPHPGRIAESVLFMFAVPLIGAWIIYAPIQHYFRTGEDYEKAEKRIQRLPLITARLIFFATLVLALTRFVAFPWLLGYAPPFGFTWSRSFELGGVIVIFYSILTYFTVSDFLPVLTRTLFKARGRIIGPFGMTIRAKIVTALVMASILPMATVTLDVLRLADDTLIAETWASISAAGLGLVFAVYFITRSLIGPVDNLVAGVRRVGDGALDTRIPVISNDELGQLTWDFNAMVEGLKEREEIRATFGRYVSNAVAERLIDDGGNLAGEVRTATVMFTDIENFTGITEHLPPERTIALLNEYLAVLAEPIERHGGVINNFIGDALFVTFNLPLEDPDHADNAVRAAQAMQRALKGRTFGDDGVEFVTRIGLNTGPVVAGTIGAGDRLGYTALGDTVNLAARAEKLNKEFGTYVLATEATVQACRAPDIFRPLGETAIRNREQPVRMYGLKDA